MPENKLRPYLDIIMSEDEIILTHILKCSRSELLLNKTALNLIQQQQYEVLKARREAGEPLQYIIGEWDFYGLTFKVNPSVLIPRPETEVLVEQAIKLFSLPLAGRAREGGCILDLGTGTGNIAITLAKFLPEARITTIDISKEALAVAQANARYHGVEDRINFIEGDMRLLDCLIARTNMFDMIISNPPYIPTPQLTQLPQDVQQEPLLALDGGADGLDFYRAIIKHAPTVLNKSGYLMMEFGDGQAEAIKGLCESLFTAEVFQDLSGKDRVIAMTKPKSSAIKNRYSSHK